MAAKPVVLPDSFNGEGSWTEWKYQCSQGERLGQCEAETPMAAGSLDLRPNPVWGKTLPGSVLSAGMLP